MKSSRRSSFSYDRFEQAATCSIRSARISLVYCSNLSWWDQGIPAAVVAWETHPEPPLEPISLIALTPPELDSVVVCRWFVSYRKDGFYSLNLVVPLRQRRRTMFNIDKVSSNLQNRLGGILHQYPPSMFLKRRIDNCCWCHNVVLMGRKLAIYHYNTKSSNTL